MSRYCREYLRKLSWRGIDPDVDVICDRCDGSGVRAYPDTSTWRGGVGGQMLTDGVCDKCWGSGKSDKPWTNLRALESRISDRLRESGEYC